MTHKLTICIRTKYILPDKSVISFEILNTYKYVHILYYEYKLCTLAIAPVIIISMYTNIIVFRNLGLTIHYSMQEK